MRPTPAVKCSSTLPSAQHLARLRFATGFRPLPSGAQRPPPRRPSTSGRVYRVGLRFLVPRLFFIEVWSNAETELEVDCGLSLSLAAQGAKWFTAEAAILVRRFAPIAMRWSPAHDGVYRLIPMVDSRRPRMNDPHACQSSASIPSRLANRNFEVPSSPLRESSAVGVPGVSHGLRSVSARPDEVRSARTAVNVSAVTCA